VWLHGRALAQPAIAGMVRRPGERHRAVEITTRALGTHQVSLEVIQDVVLEWMERLAA
jgi:hypothetical protein